MIKNGGGPYTSVGKIKIVEGPKDWLAKVIPGSVPAGRPEDRIGSGSSSGLPVLNEPGMIEEEKEPNICQVRAMTLVPGKRFKGKIDPLGEQDYFRINVPGRFPSVVTFGLAGQPNIRTSLSLLDAAGAQTLKRFDPGTTPAQEATFSWRVEPGDYLVQLTEPASSMVLVWDTSESMRNDIGNLKMAVESYLDEVRPSERLKLIRFSKDVEVITPEFLSDPAALKKAAAGKFQPIHGTSLYNAVAKGIRIARGGAGEPCPGGDDGRQRFQQRARVHGILENPGGETNPSLQHRPWQRHATVLDPRTGPWRPACSNTHR